LGELDITEQPIIFEFKRQHLKWDLIMAFTTKLPSSHSERMSVFVEFGAREYRDLFPRKLSGVHPYHARKRVYIPNKLLTDRDARIAMEGVFVLLCLYLMQGELIRGDEDELTWRFLCSYFEKFRWARQIGASSIIGEVIRCYEFPDDYRAFRMYVAKTIHGLLQKQNGQDRVYANRDPSEEVDHMIPAVASRLGVSQEKLYLDVRLGKVRADHRVVGMNRYLTIPNSEIERLENEQKEKRLRRALIAALKKMRNIDTASARRWVRRQEKHGRSVQEMVYKLLRRQEYSGLRRASTKPVKGH
jgi:hypothetical protein